MNTFDVNEFGMPKTGMDVVREEMFRGAEVKSAAVVAPAVAVKPLTRRVMDSAQEMVGGEQAVTRWRVQGLRSLVLHDKNDVYKDDVAQHADLRYLAADRVRADKAGFNMLLGGELSRVVGKGDTYGALQATIGALPEEEQLDAKGRMQKCETEYQAKELLGELWSGLVHADYEQKMAEIEKKRAEQKAAQAELQGVLENDWLQAVMEGHEDIPWQVRNVDNMERAGLSAEYIEGLRATHHRAKEAFAKLIYWLYGDTYGQVKANMAARGRELKKDWEESAHWALTEKPSDEDFAQQAAADLSESFDLSREHMAELIKLLSDESGQLDENAVALFFGAIEKESKGAQTLIDSKFWRNFGEALGDFGRESADFLDRELTRQKSTGWVVTGGLLPMPVSEGEQAEAQRRMAEEFTGDVEVLKGNLTRFDQLRVQADDRAGLLTDILTEGGTVTGASVPMLAVNTLIPGFGGLVAGAATMYPSLTNEAIARNYAAGVKNPVGMAYVEGAWQAAAEGLFAATLCKVPGVSKVGDWLGLKAAAVPGVGKALGAIQGNAALRIGTDIAMESVGELVVEEAVAETGTFLTVEGLRRLGVDFAEQEWKPFEAAWQTMQDAGQTGATVAYCAALGLLGVSANVRAARDFAGSRKMLLQAGLTEAGVAEVQHSLTEYRGRVHVALQGAGEKLRALRAEAEQKAEAEAEAKAGRPLAEAEVADAKKAAGERAVRAEVERIEEAEQGALNETMRLVYERDVLADPVALKKRMEKRGEEFLKDVEVELYARSGVLQYVLEAEKVVVGDRSDKGLYKVQLPGNKEGEVHEVEWTEQQLMAYVAMQRESGVVKRMREFQAKVAGTALAEAAKGADVHAELVNLRELPMRALARMERNGGRVDYAVMQDLAEDARERISGFVSAGMSFGDAAMQMSEVPGVTLGTLAGTADAFVQRIEELAGTAEGEVLGIKTVNDAQTHAFRVRSTVSAGQSVLLFNRGLANERELVEDLIESDVVAAVEGENATVSWQVLEGLLRRVEGELMKHGGGRLFKKGVKANAQTITEAFSKLGQSYFLLNHGRYDMSTEAHHSIEYVQKKLAEAQHLVALSHAWDAFAKSKEGKAYLKKEGASLEKLLSDAGASVAGLYDRARFEADAFYAVREAYEASVLPSPKLAEEVLGRYEAEQKELDHPEPEGVPVVVEASASITGEALTLEPAGAVDAESGAFVVPVGAEVVQDADDRGRGLVGGNYVLMEGGSVYGVAEVESIGLSADVPQFKKKDTAAGRVEADADGTTHELAGGWNENSAPIHVWRRVDGRLEVISGRHRLAHAKKNGVKYIAVRVYDEGAGFDARWAKLHDVEQNILDNTCNAVDVAYYFRHNPMPLGEAEARGLMPKTKQGEQTAASRMGLTVALQASENTFALLVNGKCTAEEAYMACVIATTEDGQQLALEAREGKAGKKNGWEYVTALVRGAEQMQPADGMLDLFGNDDSFRERSEKMARYVAAVRAGIKARLNVLQSAGRLNKKGAVSKELGVKVKTPKDTARLIARLAVLDAAYERLDPDLGIPARVDAWDGKSAVPTKLEELAGNSSFSLAGNLTPEMEEIKAAAVADGTFMKAPNGKPSNLNERQWLQVRTRAFKRWFGDWERAAELTFVSKGYDFKNGRAELDSKESVLFNEVLDLRVELNRTQKDKAFSPNARRKSIDNGFSVEQHCAVAAHLPTAFKHAMLLGEYNDAEEDANIAKIMRLGTPVIVDGQKALAFMTVKVSYQKKKEMEKPAKKVEVPRLYSLELDEIVRLGGQLKRLEHLQQNASSPSSENIVSDFNAKVKEYFENVSKIVDENGEPKVVYHGTEHPVPFSVFKSGKSGYLGPGIYFTPELRVALQYRGFYDPESGMVYSCFVNMRKPLRISYAEKPAKVILDMVSETAYESRAAVQANEAKMLRKGDLSKVKRKGYDGIVWMPKGAYDANSFTSGEMLLFDSTQIKSATDNRGTFDGRNADITFSVIGPKAKTWDKYKHRAFTGRDDGMLRAEIDASQARLKSMAVSGNAGDEYRQLVAGKEMTFETVAALDKLREQQRLIEEAESFLLERDDIEGYMAFKAEHGMDKEWWAANTELRENVKAVVKSRLLDAGVTGEGKFGGLVKSYSRLMGLIMESLLEGKVNEDVASELDAMSRYRDMTLSDALDYPELYKAYPDLKWLPVSVENLGARTAGRLVCMGDYPAEIRVNEMLNADEMRSTLLHEIQHAIQSIEEFAKGGNADSARELLERQIRQYRIRLEHLRHEQRWLYAVDTAKDHLQRMVRVLKRPRAILKMGERFAVREMQHVETMAAQAVEMMWNEYREMSIRDYGDSVAYAPGEGYKLPGRGSEAPTLAAVEKLLEKVKSLPSRRAGKLRGRRQKVEADIKRLYEENRAKLDMDGMVAHELYLRLAGEIEARNVQTRRDWTMDERLARPFNEMLEYPGEALVTFSMAAVTAAWSDTLERFRVMPPKAGTVPYRKDLYVCPTPAVMQMVGAKGWDIVMSPRVVVKCLHADTVLGNGMKLMEYYAGQEHWHDIALDVMKQLPAALADPICITVSDTPGCIEVVTELKEGNDNILVAVQLDSKKEGARTQSVNRIVSLYGKEKIEALLAHPRLYWNNAKARFWTGGKGLQLPVAPYPKRASARRVLTPADLVKYKMQTGLSFSLSGPDMVNVADTGRMAGEDKMQRLLKHAHKEAARWMRTFGKEVPAAKAAELMGSVSSIMGAIYKELPPKYRPRLDGHMRYVEVYARLLESGKVRTYGKLNKAERAAVEAELMEALREEQQRADAAYELAKKDALDAAELTGAMAALEEAATMDVDDEVKRAAYLDRLAKRTANETRRRLLAEAEAKKKQMDAEVEALKRDFAAEKLAKIAGRMLNEAADAVEQYLIDEVMQTVPMLLERLTPRKLPNGKYDKGRMSADAYRKLVKYVQMIETDGEEVAKQLEKLGTLIAAEEAKSDDEAPDGEVLDALQAELAEWSTYGNLREKCLDAVRKGVAALREFAVYEKNAWSGFLQLQRNRAKRIALRAADALGGADEFKVKEESEKSSKLKQRLADLGAGLQSIGQMFYGLAGVPELRGLVDESLDALSAGHVALTLREKRAYEQLAEYMKRMGLDTENKRNNWMAALKKKHNTGIMREGILVRHRLKLTPEEAEMWLSMTKGEREVKRAELEADADKKEVLVENVPYEEDIPLLREALAEFRAEPEGKKWVHTYREFRKDAPKEPMVLSKDEAMNILLLCEQGDYLDAAHDNGYTDEVLEQLGAFVGAEVMSFGYAMRGILEGNGLAEVYEAREGVPFPAVKNYWPGNFDQSARVNEQANALDPTSGNGTRYGMLITRVKHKLRFNILGATNVFMAALAQQNNYIVMGELTAKWRRLLSHNDFAMSLKQYMGVAQFKQFKELIELLDGAGVQESITQQTLSGVLGQFQSAHAMAVLAGSPITLVKQVSAMINAGAWEGISMGRVLARIVLDRFDKGAIRYRDMLKKDYFRARCKDNRYFTEMMQLGRDANWSKLSKWARTGMGWIEKMDVLTNCAGMTALYNITYHDLKYRNDGAADPLTEEEMHAECDRVVRNALELGAQPLRRTQKSAFAALSRNALVKMTCYMGSEAINKVGVALSLRKRTGGGIKGFLKAWKYLAGVSLAQQIIVMALDMARNADPIDDDEWAEWALLNLATGVSGLGILQSMPVLGEAVQEFTGGYAKTGSLGQMVYDFGGALRSGMKVAGMATDDKEDSLADWAWAVGNLGRHLTFATGAWGGITSTSKSLSELSGLLQSLNAMANVVRPFVQAERNEVKQEKAFRKKVEKGWTEARKKTRERMKEKREKEKAEEKAKKKQEEILKRL